MRKLILAVLAASGLAALGAAPAQAVGTRYPFCLQGDEYPGLSYCTFTSYEQCQATASGRFLTCIANPYYVSESEPPRAGYRPLPGRTLPPAPPAPADTERPTSADALADQYSTRERDLTPTCVSRLDNG